MDSKFQKRKKMILIIDSKFQKRKGKENEKENLPSVKKHGPKWNSLKCIFNTPFGTK